MAATRKKIMLIVRKIKSIKNKKLQYVNTKNCILKYLYFY